MKEQPNSLGWRSLARRFYAPAMGGPALVLSRSLSLSRMGCWRIGHLPSTAPCLSEVGKLCCSGLETSSLLPEMWKGVQFSIHHHHHHHHHHHFVIAVMTWLCREFGADRQARRPTSQRNDRLTFATVFGAGVQELTEYQKG